MEDVGMAATRGPRWVFIEFNDTSHGAKKFLRAFVAMTRLVYPDARLVSSFRPPSDIGWANLTVAQAKKEVQDMIA
jgi:hypothetical protein